MNVVRQLHDEIAVIGWACRMPGANSIEQLWSLLLEGKCAVSRVPPDRFPADYYQHPRRQERGRSVTFAAGVIDDVWGFDPAVFGIAPREAAQMDPQQRILLQLTWEALEDAGIPPSSIAGSDVGVFVGASLVEYSNVIYGDPSVADSHFATGNSLSTISNRISYIFNLRGPSITVDTACSSSLVALHAALEALRSGRIDTAIVGGINIIASPFTFVSFSQASMLSPTGLCRAFSAEADGFVRAEGGAVLVLRKSALANANQNPCHGILLASDVNSDGRTNGISLPSSGAQKALLERVYSRANINPQNLAFVEAHGTGTPVGDPIEASAIGLGLARDRSTPLLIGSIKTNIGHLEAASGMAGLLKAMLALQHGVVPKSLHFSHPNKNIDFESLNLRFCDQPMLLNGAAGQCVGVSSFGFGGTNAHVIVGPGRRAKAVPHSNPANGNAVIAISAASRAALAALASNYAERVNGMSQLGISELAGAAAHRRDQLPHRAVISTLNKRDVLSALDSASKNSENVHLTVGESVGADLPIAFVYSGNGSQWIGMGRAAYQQNQTFRAHFDEVDSLFGALSGWSLKSTMFDVDAENRLKLTNVAQPLIFVIQSAATAALRHCGMAPSAVLGHSVGEIAAAEAAEILDLRSAIKVIYHRSVHQETVRGMGKMAALLASPERAKELITSFEGIEIAAFNSPYAVTVAGPTESLAALNLATREARIAFLDLELDYPFHTRAMELLKNPLQNDLADVRTHDSSVPFVSTVTGTCLPGERLNASYWWRNIREPVRFSDAVREAARVGARCFVEIGPRGMLAKHLNDCLENEVDRFATLNVLDRGETKVDPFAKVLARALVIGAKVDRAAVMPSDPGPHVSLPAYPWQQEAFRFEHTSEAFGPVETEKHPFRNFRMTGDGVEWRCFLDTECMPSLADHKVGSQTIFPGTGFLELAFIAAKQFLQTDKISLSHLEILRPLDISAGKTREVMTRISPGSLMIEIFSRPRLVNSTWQLNFRGKIGHGLPRPKSPDSKKPAKGKQISGERIYELADANGLHYGPAFRVVRSIRNFKDRELAVDLVPSNASPEYLLDPMRLDACVHSIVTLFSGLNTIERGVTYIPVRIDKTTLYASGELLATAKIRVLVKNDRSILLNFDAYDQHGQLIVSLTGVRAQAIPVRHISSFGSLALLERRKLADGTLGVETGVPVKPSNIFTEALASGSILQHPPQSEAHLLLQGWATIIAHQIVLAIPENQSLDLEALSVSDRIDPQSVNWLLALLRRLASVGLAEYDGHKWKLNREEELPSPGSLVQELAVKHPHLAAELLVAGEVTGCVARFFDESTVSAEGLISSATREFYRDSSVTLRSAIGHLIARIRFVLETRHSPRTLRVLQVGHNSLTISLAGLLRNFSAVHTILEPNEELVERAKIDLQFHREIEVLASGSVLKSECYDLIVSASGLTALPNDKFLTSLNLALAPNGILIAVEPQPALIHDLLAGADLVDRSSGVEGVARSARGIQSWPAALKDSGFSESSAHLVDCVTDFGLLIIAGKGAFHQTSDEEIDPLLPTVSVSPSVVIVPANSAENTFSRQLKRELEKKNQKATILARSAKFADAEARGAITLIDGSATNEISAKRKLTERCLSLKACLDQIGSCKAPIWLIFSGALESQTGEIDPVEAGAWAFTRVAANEYQNLDIRRIDVAPGIPAQIAVEKISNLLITGTDETEIQLEDGATRVVRIEHVSQVPTGSVDPAAKARLQKLQSTPHRVAWSAVERAIPKPSEVEILIAATGLNFRDLMSLLGLLPDDILEDGYTGATLGLECAGKVSAIGSAVTNLKVDDRVVTFAPAAFSTHVTLPASQVVKIPASMSFEAAATIPVAFLTAYYGLVTLAKLKRQEWVLIHAAAGGVGMAAIQIAKTCGARIIATAGSEAKRSLLRSLGVQHVLDSRSNGFADEIRAITGMGADVVLNSLAGEAMELSIECLRPFGRFIELGKRDYVSNTHIGLRPFRKNLSYFGVDIDQLLTKNKNSAPKLFRKLMSYFEKGTYSPLPHSVFPAEDIERALQLMQKSRHIGKIVVNPPPLRDVKAASVPFKVNPKGTHLITGAFGGFGLETAKWLADRGARSLVMIGRSGAASQEAKETLIKLRKRGVKVLEAALDVADAEALAELFENLRKTMPPLCGVIHAAMVLDDAVIANLNRERFERVLAPKVEGAENLDRLTRHLPLDYFVLFSSVTTMIGNPGQANYVAANGFMEGLARRRKKRGLPALAIGWGPITDVGVLARNERLQASLSKLRRVKGMTSREALDLMASAIEQSSQSQELAVVTIAPYDRGMAKDRLKLLRSPTFKVFAEAAADLAEGGAEFDLHELLQSSDIETVRTKIANIVVSQIAKVLRFREGDISRNRPLSDLGLDSLMSLELALNLEAAFNIQAPLSSSAAELTVTRIADEILAQAASGEAATASNEVTAAAIAAKHIAGADSKQIDILDTISHEPRRQTRLLS